MSRINSKKKGSRFERLCTRVLSRLTGEPWHRVGVSSGARYTTDGIERFRGDVFCEAEKYSNITVECKKRKSRVSVDEIIFGIGIAKGWRDQVEKESRGKNWILMWSWDVSRKIFFLADNSKTLKRIGLNVKANERIASEIITAEDRNRMKGNVR